MTGTAAAGVRGASLVGEIEDALVAHWSLFGRWPKGTLHDEGDLVWFETPIRHLPYNGVLRSRLGADAEKRVASVTESFRSRGVDFFWMLLPSARPPELGELLLRHGVRPVETLTGMALDLAGWEAGEPRGDAQIVDVVDDDGLRAYQGLTVRYWELPDDDAALVGEVQRTWRPGRAPGHRFLALVDGRPVGKAYLALGGPAGVAAIYGMYVAPEARGRGIAGDLTRAMLARAKDLGRMRMVLHATEMAVAVYRRAGFAEHCRFTVCATVPIWNE